MRDIGNSRLAYFVPACQRLDRHAANTLFLRTFRKDAGREHCCGQKLAQTAHFQVPDNPELLVELAISLASAKAYDEANSQLQSAVGKFLSAGDKRTAA